MIVPFSNAEALAWERDAPAIATEDLGMFRLEIYPSALSHFMPDEHARDIRWRVILPDGKHVEDWSRLRWMRDYLQRVADNLARANGYPRARI